MMKKYIFAIDTEENPTWKDDLCQQFLGIDGVIVIDAGFAGLAWPGTVYSDNPEVETILRLKFSDIRCYDEDPGQRVV